MQTVKLLCVSSAGEGQDLIEHINKVQSTEISGQGKGQGQNWAWGGAHLTQTKTL